MTIDGLTLCIFAFLLCLIMARKSLGHGVCALLAVGYFYGIVRANYLDGLSHFIFDMGVWGLYAGQFTKPLHPNRDARSKTAKRWVFVLLAWPAFLFILPIHHYLIQLVGLRHIVLLLPVMLLGARLREKDLERVTNTLAVLNVISFVFALLEYRSGLAPFYPHNSVTENMYRSHDIRTAEGIYYRIPATFVSAHVFAGTMAVTSVFLLNAMLDPRKDLPRRIIMGAVLVITMLGLFIAGPRLPVVQIGLFAALMILLPGLSASVKTVLGVCLAVIGIICAIYIADDPRMQRFTSLVNVEMVEQRATGSVGFSLVENMLKRPLGVGLGGAAGASIPYFLKEYAPEQVGAENEFIRIAVEQGIVGFVLWMLLLIHLASRRPQPVASHWEVGTQAMKAIVIANWGTAFVGTGLMQAVPTSLLLLLMMGHLLRTPEDSAKTAEIPDSQPRHAPLPGAASFEKALQIPSTR